MRCILQAYPHHSISPHSACILQPYPQKFHLYPFARGVARMHKRRNAPLPFCQGSSTHANTQAHAEEHANSPKSPELPFIISTLLSTLPYCKGSIKHQTHHNANILQAYPLYHPGRLLLCSRLLLCQEPSFSLAALHAVHGAFGVACLVFPEPDSFRLHLV